MGIRAMAGKPTGFAGQAIALSQKHKTGKATPSEGGD